MLKIVVGVCVVIAAAVIGISLVDNKLGTGSGIIRMDDLMAGMKAFLHNPILGAGYANMDEIVKYQEVIRSNSGLSMGIAVLMAYGGLWLFGVYAGAVIVSRRISYFAEYKRTWFLVWIVLLYNLFISNAAFSDVYVFLIAAAYAASGDRSYSRMKLGKRRIRLLVQGTSL